MHVVSPAYALAIDYIGSCGESLLSKRVKLHHRIGYRTACSYHRTWTTFRTDAVVFQMTAVSASATDPSPTRTHIRQGRKQT